MTVQWGDNRVEKLTPPGVADERTRLMVEAIAAVMLEEETSTCIIGWDNAPIEMLPAMIVENSLQEFIEPGLPEPRIREIGKQAFYLHAIKGFDFGVLYALAAFDLEAEILQWYLKQPPGPHDTHAVTVDTQQDIFNDGEIWTGRTYRQIWRIIDNMKRWSQDTSVALAAASKSKTYAAAFPMTHLSVTALPFVFDPPVASGSMRSAVAPLTRLSITAHAMAA